MNTSRVMVWALAVTVCFVTDTAGRDLGKPDVLRVTDARGVGDCWSVGLDVINDQPLAGMDIPLRFGQPGDPIELVRVEFVGRVVDWDFTHAQIDNQNKTVILGLISELISMRPNADLDVSAAGKARVAELIFRMDTGYKPHITTFTTIYPDHRLTFLYNEVDVHGLTVKEYEPRFEVDVNLKETVLPREFSLSENYPNPFNPSTSFDLSLPVASEYAIHIYNVTGQQVRTYRGRLEAGVHRITWDGRNGQGTAVASGAYFYRVEAGSFTDTRRMMLLK